MPCAHLRDANRTEASNSSTETPGGLGTIPALELLAAEGGLDVHINELVRLLDRFNTAEDVGAAEKPATGAPKPALRSVACRELCTRRARYPVEVVRHTHARALQDFESSDTILDPQSRCFS
eukprot:SAG31_NODE_5_length_43735_cov_42.922266_4_plen_122_part_00